MTEFYKPLLILKNLLYIVKQSKPAFGSSWNKRWFSIGTTWGGTGKELALSYYTKRGAYDPNGWLFLRDIRDVAYSNELRLLSIDSRNKGNVLGIDEIEGTQYGFIVVADSRNFFLKCENQVDLLKWVEGLRIICGLSSGGKWPAAAGTPPQPVKYLVDTAKDRNYYLKYDTPAEKAR
jgi:hypothetical protein